MNHMVFKLSFNSDEEKSINVSESCMWDHITFLSYHPSQSISILDGCWNLNRTTEVVVKEAKVMSELNQVLRLGVHRIIEDGIM